MSEKKIEDIINGFIASTEDNGKLEFAKTAMECVSYLKESDITLVDKGNGFWNGVYKGEDVCVINAYITENNCLGFDIFMEPPSAWITPPGGDDNNEEKVVQVDERTKKIVWDNIRYCDPTCRGKCSPGKQIGILGKTFDKVCKCTLGIYFIDTETLECVKKMVDEACKAKS